MSSYRSMQRRNNFWVTCTGFMHHLCRYEARYAVLGPKIQGLPYGHPYKPECLFELSQLFDSIGSQLERKRTLTRAYGFGESGGDFQAARILQRLSDTNWPMDLPKCDSEGSFEISTGTMHCFGCKRRCFLRVLTLPSRLRELNESIGGRVELSKCITRVILLYVPQYPLLTHSFAVQLFIIGSRLLVSLSFTPRLF